MASKSDGTDTYTYEWNYDDRLTVVKLNGVSQASYEYDSMGRMLKRTVGANLTTFKWDGWNLLQEQGPGLETLYIAPEGEIMAVHVGANTYQLHADQVGSVHTITNSAGAVVGEQALDPWGVRLQATGISLPCSGFVGKYGIREDSATGLIYMRNRWYDATLQRFISADPISIEGGLNLYLYAGADPVNAVDLLGLEPGDNCGCPQKKQTKNLLIYLMQQDSSSLFVQIGDPKLGYTSFAGHASITFKGTTYSNGPAGVARLSATDYYDFQTKQRESSIYKVKLTKKEQGNLEGELLKSKGAPLNNRYLYGQLGPSDGKILPETLTQSSLSGYGPIDNCAGYVENFLLNITSEPSSNLRRVQEDILSRRKVPWGPPILTPMEIERSLSNNPKFRL